MPQRIERQQLQTLIQSQDLAEVPHADLLDLFRKEHDLQQHLPSGMVASDPRSGDQVLFAPSRGQRPQHTSNDSKSVEIDASDCPICAGETTGVIDVAELSDGVTFINKNLYPMLYPFEQAERARGLHLLQWTSSQHDRDWHNLPLHDCETVLERLAAVERRFAGPAAEPLFGPGPTNVTIIKNAGGPVGASLSHGHQQIAVGGPRPGLVKANLDYEQREGHSFAEYLLRTTREELVVEDYSEALLLVPPFMKRPYEMTLVLKDAAKAHLHQLSEAELAAVARGWHEATRALHRLMPALGRSVAYNVLTANGPGAGLYFEFLPHTQTTGGFERMGLYVCQSSPAEAAADLRRALEQSDWQ